MMVESGGGGVKDRPTLALETAMLQQKDRLLHEPMALRCQASGGLLQSHA